MNFLKDKNLAKYILIIFSGFYISLLLYASYQIGAYEKLERLLSDFKTRLKPQIVQQKDIAIISISEQDIKIFDGPNAKKLSPSSLEKIIEATLYASPKAVGIVLPAQDFSYDDPEFIKVLNKYRNNSRIYWGDYQNSSFVVPTKSKDGLISKIPSNVYSANTFIASRFSIIRHLYMKDYRGSNVNFHLVTKMALDHSDKESKKEIQKLYKEKGIFDSYFKINYYLPHTFQTIASTSMLNTNSPSLKGKLVLIGYTAFREHISSNSESTYRKSPWQNESDSISKTRSIPSIYIFASGLSNLIKREWIQEFRNPIIHLQTILFTILCFLIWRYGAIYRTFTIYLLLFLLAFILFTFQVLMLQIYNLNLKLADTVIFSFVATIIGAFWGAQKGNQLRATKYLKSNYQQKMAKIQENFLSKFSNDIFEMNENIKKILEKHTSLYQEGPPTLSKAYIQAVSSNLEMEEYLDGIRQFASLDVKEISNPNKEPVNLVNIINKMIKKFESKIQESEVKIHFNNEGQAYGWSDILYLEPILFNLISNAIKYSPQGGNVFISIINQDKKNYTIQVRDEGPGIADDLKERIFEKFYRIQNDTVYKVKGNGLGLYLAQFFAKRMETEIKVSSKLNEGSMFSVEVERFKL